MTPDRENIRFNTLRNALYHTARRGYFERWNRIFNFLVLILGASAIGNVFAVVGIPLEWVGAAIAVIAALQLVLDFGRQARDHQTLQREYYHLLADIEGTLESGPEHCAEWYSRMIRITADEPPTLRALDAKAYNDALDSIGTLPQEERLWIPFLYRVFGGFYSFEGYNYLKLSEMRTRKA